MKLSTNTETMTRSELIVERDNIYNILYFVGRGSLKLEPDRLHEMRDLLDDIQRALDTGEYRPEEVSHAAAN